MKGLHYKKQVANLYKMLEEILLAQATGFYMSVALTGSAHLLL